MIAIVTEKLLYPATRIVDKVTRIAQSMGFPYVGSAHLLLVIVQDQTSLSSKVLKEMGILPEALKKTIADLYMSKEETEIGKSDLIVPSPRLESILVRAECFAQEREISPTHLCLAMLREENSEACEILNDAGVSFDSFLAAVNKK